MNTVELQEKVSPKDVFIHLLAIVALYASAISFLVLAFKAIGLAFPDPVDGGGSYVVIAARQAIRQAIATLVVMFPLYLFVTRRLNASYVTEPMKLQLRIRKWLVHFTLFVAALVIAGDCVTLIYNFLEGELTVRFFLKVIAVLFVAGSIFWYYLADLKDLRNAKSTRILASCVVALIGGSIIGGFFMVGSPTEERLRRADERRVGDLQYIQSELISYWQNKQSLPEKLEMLRDDLRGVNVPSDPETGTPYGFEVKGPESFSLCATFSRADTTTSLIEGSRMPVKPYGPYMGESTWQHGEGLHCFERTIDREFFKPLQ